MSWSGYRKHPVLVLGDKEPLPLPAENSPREGPIVYASINSVPRLIDAYRKGLFPWHHVIGDLWTWWSPDPRAVFLPNEVTVSARQRNRLRNSGLRFSMDTAFHQVVSECAAPRRNRSETWITPQIVETYGKAHRAGMAHSVEAWREGELVGGLYGVAIGSMFSGESMFHKESNASKFAFWVLVAQLRKWGFKLIDAQYGTDHLLSLGARMLSREVFLRFVSANNGESSRIGRWSLDVNLEDSAWGTDHRHKPSRG